MRTFAITIAAAGLVIGATLAPARAEVATSGSFSARLWCQAYQSIRKGTNPGRVRLRPGRTYEVVAKNKPVATYYRVAIDGAEPRERWVKAWCGRVSPGVSDGTATGPVAANTGPRATHVLALGWEPAFCDKHGDKSECRELTAGSFAATHLSLHGLWPQPRGTQYCNVASDLRQADRNHDWNGLPEPEIDAATMKRLSAVMPGVQSKLQRHEWIVHGTCYGGNASDYFARAAGLAETVDASPVSKLFADNAGRVVTAEAIRAAFDAAFGSGAGQRVAVSCGGRREERKITELVINLAGDVRGGAGLGQLLQAAPPVPAGCPSGLVQAAPAQ